MKAILFDFDGTIADTAPGIVATMTETFRQMKLPIPTEEAMRQTIGIPLGPSLQHLNNLSEKKTKEAVDTYTRLFMTIEIGKTRLFDGVAETLKKLHDEGFRMSVVTSRNVESLEVILKRFGIRDCFEHLVTHSDGLAHKPAPDMVFETLRRMKLTSDDTIVVGDTTFDIEMGNNAGCKTVAVTYGNHSREKLQTVHPTWIIDSFPELLSL